MTNKGEQLSAKLEKVQKNIEDTRRLIAYHKKMLKIYIRKEAELSEKLEKERFNDLYKAVRENGCDIAAINDAIKSGEFSAENEADGEKAASLPKNSENSGHNNDSFHEKDKEDKR